MDEKERTETLTIRVPSSLKLRIAMSADKDGRTINSFINKIIKEYFNEQKRKK